MDSYNHDNFSAWGMPNSPVQEEYPEQYNSPSRLQQINKLLDDRLNVQEAIKAVKTSSTSSEKIISDLYKALNRIDEELGDIK